MLDQFCEDQAYNSFEGYYKTKKQKQKKHPAKKQQYLKGTIGVGFVCFLFLHPCCLKHWFLLLFGLVVFGFSVSVFCLLFSDTVA